MRSIRDLGSGAVENVNFYIVGSDLSQTLDKLEANRQDEGYPGAVAEIADTGLRDLKIIKQSTKIALDGNGVITYRDSFGQGNIDVWGQVLTDLASG